MKLFDEKKRYEKSEIRKNRSLYDFFDESSLEKYEKIRNLLNEALSLYDEASQNRIIDDIVKNKNSDEKFYSNCFELIVSYMFRKIGQYELEPHPILANNKKPDFLVTVPNFGKFYLELVTVDENDMGDLQFNILKTYIKKFRNTNELSNEVTVISIKSLNGRNFSHENVMDLQNAIRVWWGENKNNIGSKLEKEMNGNLIHFEIVKENSLRVESIIDETDFYKKFLSSLEYKSKKYGELDLPYLIAITFRPSNLTDGLILQENFIASCLYGGFYYEPKSVKKRKIHSLWEIFEENKRNNQVSGVLYFDSLIPENLESFRYSLFLNYYSKFELPHDLKSFLPFYCVVNKSEAFQSEIIEKGDVMASGRFI